MTKARLTRLVVIGLSAVLLAAGAAAAWAYRAATGPGPLHESATTVIARGSGVRDIAYQLARASIIEHPRLFELLVLLRGAQMLGTAAALADYLFLTCIQPLKPGDEDQAISLVVPINAPGLRLYARRAYALGASSVFDYPLSTRFDESDALAVFHDVFVAVDEKGVEAAAASAVVIMDTGHESPVPEVSVTADRPFLFAIRDLGTDSLLFLGQVVRADHLNSQVGYQSGNFFPRHHAPWKPIPGENGNVW